METDTPASPSVDEARQNALREYRQVLLQHKEADAKVCSYLRMIQAILCELLRVFANIAFNRLCTIPSKG